MSRYGILITKSGREQHKFVDVLTDMQHSGKVHFAGRREGVAVFIENNEGMHWYRGVSGGYAVQKAVYGKATLS